MAEQSNQIQCDVLVAGGGMVGAALACALAERQFSVVVVELKEPAHDWPGDEVDLRVSALTRASEQILRNLGVWERMAELRISPYREMLVWDAGGRGSIHFDAAEIGEPDLGHIVENRITQLALWEKLGALESVQRICPDSISSMDTAESGCRVVLKSGVKIEAALVVGAEGAKSSVRDIAAITSSGWAYDQHAIVATIWPEQHHGDVARQRFMPQGPLAFLPIDNGCCSIVWSTSPQEAEQLMALDDESFCKALTQASERMLGDVTRVGPRGVFPLRLRNADHYVKPGLALVGDAAHGIHPLAGQGVNLGFLDAAALVDVLVEAREHGRALSSMATLRRYERARKGANIAMLGAMDGFKRLFSNRNLPLALLRNLGLSLADAAGPIKQLITRRALGLVGELPKLARRGGW
ncbi:MAG: UbiH/UbiF/VisC/COQ6 family ubiquinone biosynthesis hydroxylase [Chromatiales bacterium]|nr:UbiH/UbiF/VisC/COQ6 family ubiquinone biosynthesis hydroxylase [Chromatiales bacterium]